MIKYYIVSLSVDLYAYTNCKLSIEETIDVRYHRCYNAHKGIFELSTFQQNEYYYKVEMITDNYNELDNIVKMVENKMFFLINENIEILSNKIYKYKNCDVYKKLNRELKLNTILN